MGTYLPGFKGGGHIRSIKGLVDYLGKDLDFYIICQDRDADDKEPYKDITTGAWVKLGNSQVMYLNSSDFSLLTLKSIFHNLLPDVIYLNTIFSVRETILPAILGMSLKSKPKVIVAPRGCLDPGALSLKYHKKRVFLQLLKLSRLQKHILWHASTITEADFIRKEFGDVNIMVAQNLPSLPKEIKATRPLKNQGEARMIFLARIVPIKNLIFLLDILKSINGKASLTIAGPIEDPKYWDNCQMKLAELTHVNYTLVGAIEHDQVASLLGEHHFYILPTLGENFGHSIIEAFDSGLGVIISDQTPWKDLERYGVGWDISLENRSAWVQAVQACVDMNNCQFIAMSNKSKSIRNKFWNNNIAINDNLNLFDFRI